MTLHFYRNFLLPVCLCLILSWLSGCAGLNVTLPVSSLSLTENEASQVGDAIGEKLLQMLGGPYFDKALKKDVQAFCDLQFKDESVYKILIADSNKVALYPLPGGRIILTRGLLTHIDSGTELKRLLTYAMQLSDVVYTKHATENMNQAIKEILSNSEVSFDPNSSSIRAARLFKKAACDQRCLDSSMSFGTAGNADVVLPESVQRLSQLKDGYELLVRAKTFEKNDEPSKAIAIYLEAAAKTPDEPHILSSLGFAYLRAGQLQSARLHLKKAAKLQPDFYKSRMGLGYLYLQLGQLRQASQLLAESVRMLPVTENLFLLAETREKSGDINGARSLYQVVADTDRHSKLGQTSARRLKQAERE